MKPILTQLQRYSRQQHLRQLAGGKAEVVVAVAVEAEAQRLQVVLHH